MLGKEAAYVPRRKSPPIIEEVTLENFMSYEYAKIPLKPGLNIICGPNGAGKSSILLAISVALGQAYTERARKLSDLIRRGKDIARVTITFGTVLREGENSSTKHRPDKFVISRYIKKDGTYWYEVNFHPKNKEEVSSLLTGFGIDPNNLLIIMHQGMLEEFVTTTPPQKLKMVEDAVGFREYREKILEAQTKLTKLLSEEASITSLLENAEQTLNHWKEEYERYLRKKELLEKRDFLERELAWSQVIRKEKVMQSLEDKIRKRKLKLENIKNRIEKARKLIGSLQQALSNLSIEQKKQFFTLLSLEKERSEAETAKKILSEVIEQLQNQNPLAENLQAYLHEAKSQIERTEENIGELKKKISAIQSSLDKTEKTVNPTMESYIDERVEEAVLLFRKEMTENEIAEYEKELKEAQSELSQLLPIAEKMGERVKTERSSIEVSEDLKVTNAYITSIGEVSEDTEKMYKHYMKLYSELKEKLTIVSENRKRVLEEIEVRKNTWKNILQKLLDDVNPIYNQILSRMDAIGRVRLTNLESIETAGLELSVGFRGAEPAVLDAYTQSGGERSVAVMSFLLALQHRIESPFRAVDEFDIHMDPRNREAIYQVLISTVKADSEVQNVVITPGTITSADKDVHIITVQNVRGVSEVRTVNYNV